MSEGHDSIASQHLTGSYVRCRMSSFKCHGAKTIPVRFDVAPKGFHDPQMDSTLTLLVDFGLVVLIWLGW